MPVPFNPINSGFRAVRRDPVIVLTEVLWRWSFGVIASLILFFSGLVLLGAVPDSSSTMKAFRSHDPALMAFMTLHVVRALGNKAIVAAIALPASIALLWSVLAALGRSVTLKRLRPGVAPLSFRALLALHCLRALIAWMALLAIVGAIGTAVWIAISSSKPDLFLFYIIVTPTVLLIGGLWLAVNWSLSLAGVFGTERKSFWDARRQAKLVIRAQRSDFAGTSFVFLLLRLVALLIAFAAIGIPSGMINNSPQDYAALFAAVLLAYFAVGDFLYVARMASYLALASAHAEAAGAERGQVSSSLGARQTSAL
jgi:hypothetical protein